MEVAYADLERLPGGAYTKAGLRGHPGIEEGQALLVEALGGVDAGGLAALDLSARGGAAAVALHEAGARVTATDPSAAALRALSAAAASAGFAVHAGPAGALEGPFDLVLAIPPADRGSLAVRTTLAEAARLARPGGRLLVAGEKNRGFERYLREAREVFGDGEVVERSRGWRAASLERSGRPAPVPPEPAAFAFDARGRRLDARALPGAFSGRGLDAATELLLRHLPAVAGRRALDLGCGWGAIGVPLALEGASVTMLDDDLPSVLSARATLEANAAAARVLHSDVDSALEPADRFGLVVTNPPFHVGARLVLDVALEFVAAAARRLERGGELWLVANHFLPYERPMAAVGGVREVARERGFKLLVARRP